MSSSTERKIRDALAERLEILEPGLELVGKEFRLPNPLGGKGFVDILARDRFGVYVVIELKRSDSTARDALHEMFKYTALLRQNHGLGDSQVRCMAVSTEWHELLVPFSELTTTAPFHVDGYEITVDSEGMPLSAKEVIPAGLDSALELCPSGFMFLYTSARDREGQRGTIEAAAEQVGVEDYVLIEQDHRGPSGKVVYPFGDAFVMATLDSAKRERAIRRFGIDQGELEEVGEMGNPWYLEEHVLGELTRVMERKRAMDVEILYPDKFRAHEDRWPVTAVRRMGPKLKSILRTDEDILGMVRGNQGGLSSLCEHFAAPRVKHVWRQVRSDIRHCLTGNEEWLASVDVYLDQREELETSGVALKVYNPGDLLMGLFKLGAEENLGYLPALEIFSEPGKRDPIEVAVGFVQWDGVTIHENPEQLLGRFFDGDLMNYFIRRTVGESWQIDDELLKWHGLVCALYGLKFTDEVRQWSRLGVTDGALSEEVVPEIEVPLDSMIRFARAHQSYLRALVSMIRSQSIGL